MAALSNEIYIGSLDAPLFYFSNASIVEATGEYAVDLISNELSIDRLTPVTRYTFYAQMALQPTDYDALETSDGYILCGYWNENPADVPYGTELWYYVDGELSGKFYIEYVERVAKDRWKINAVSVVGLLDLQYHRGGVYTGQSFAEVLTEFFGGTVGESADGITPITGGLVNCYCADDVAVTTVHGLLPYDTKRNNLHQLIFAHVVNMTKDGNGDLLFSYLANNDNPPLIPRDRIYLSGDVAYEQPVTDVELTEYTYVYDETAEPEEIYDNVSAPHISGEALVIFDKPINPETITTSEPTMIVRDANEVSAYVTGNGIISAVPYQVQSRVISRGVDKPGVQKTVSVTDVTLVNPLNSTSVMDRLFEFYTQRKVVRSSIVVKDEKPGALYQFYNPYDELDSGFIGRMSFNTTSVTKADCEIITNYTPTGKMTNLRNAVLLTGSGVWTVPPAIKERDDPYIRVTLIGGGQGGHGGYSGESSERRPDSPGKGGAGGEGGHGGKILSAEIDVSELDAIAYSCGLGGAGGESDTAGAEGTDTTFGEYSTEYGAVAPGGIMNIINGKFYARSGVKGYAGAAGGKGAQPASNSPTAEELATYGENGEDLTVKDETWEGGKGGRSNNASQGGYFGWAFGGGGGGAAYGADGGDGTDGHVQWQAVIGGFGGAGATAAIPGDDAQNPGEGGHGGHGGGGGGAPGSSGFSGGSTPVGYVGAGGAGSPGGRGASGCVLIYY
jgi:hypothetical protein